MAVHTLVVIVAAALLSGVVILVGLIGGFDHPTKQPEQVERAQSNKQLPVARERREYGKTQRRQPQTQRQKPQAQRGEETIDEVATDRTPNGPATSPAETELASLTNNDEVHAGGKQHLAFDVARVDPAGTSVFAGRGEAGKVVSLMADGRIIGTTKINAGGTWLLVLDHKFAKPDPNLSLAYAAPRAKPVVRQPPAPDRLDQHDVAGLADDPRSVREVNARMMSNLQSLVDRATQQTRKQTGARQRPPGVVATTPSQTSTSDRPGERVTARQQVAATGTDKTTLPAASKLSTRPGAAPVPVPIQFVYRTSQFTPDGMKAARLVLNYLIASQFESVTLTGHADDRGPPEYNHALSHDRLLAVEAFLRRGGYKGRLHLIPKGESQPYRNVDRSKFTTSELHQLDRRVELVTSARRAVSGTIGGRPR